MNKITETKVLFPTLTCLLNFYFPILQRSAIKKEAEQRKILFTKAFAFRKTQRF